MTLKILSQNLGLLRRSCCYRRALNLTGLALLPPGLLCCMLNAREAFAGLQETAAAFWAGVLCLIFAVVFGLLLYRRVIRSGSSDWQNMAKTVEKRHPELQDAFFAAVELENQSRELRPMENLLLENMQSAYGRRMDFLRDAFAGELSWRRPLCMLAAALAVWGIAAATGNLWPKAFYYYRTGGDSGLHFHEFQKEYPVHSDVRIAVDILRWEKKAGIEIRNAAGQTDLIPMTDSLAGTSVFTFYNLSEDCAFRIVTPSLKSRWRQIQVYTPPAADEIRLTAAPPAYTRGKSRSWTALQDLDAIAGSALVLEVKAPERISADLSADGRKLQGDRQNRIFRTLLQKNSEFVLTLGDREGHQVSYPPFKVTVIPDMPPVVEVREPEPDARVRRGDSVRLVFFAGDDFGVSRARLRFSVSGSRKQVIELFRAAEGRENPEEEVVWLWNLPKYQVRDGDLLSCFIEVADNRAPEPQWTRSDLFFLTVRPNEESLEENQQQGQDSGQKFNVSDLITENKRLLRLSLDSMGAELKDRKRNQFELHGSLNELSLEVIRRMNELVKMSMGRPQPGLPELFRLSSGELKKAARLVESMLFEESLQPEEVSLTALIRIENELIKNSMRSKQGQGQKESEEQQRASQQEKQEQAQSRQSAKEQLARMKKMLEELRNLAGRQQRYNERCRKQAAMPEALGREQKGIQKSAEQAGRELAKMPQAVRSAGHLTHAVQEMNQGAQAMQEGRASAGEIHGVRALQKLEQAVRSLESAVRKETASQVERLAEAAGQLADRQRQAAQQSAEAADQPDAAARAKEQRTRQKQLSAMTRALKQEIQEVASMLEKDFPEAAADMRKRSEESTRRGLEKAQKRAENGLLYRRFDSARKSQQEAANLLQGLAQGLHESAGKMPPVSADELRDALEQLQQKADQIAGEMSESGREPSARRIQQSKRESGEMLQRLSESLRDSRLRELSDLLKFQDSSSSPAQAGAHGLELLRASADILLQHLQKLERGEKLRLNRSQMLPPEKYRRQVQEYFKNLGEEK